MPKMLKIVVCEIWCVKPLDLRGHYTTETSFFLLFYYETLHIVLEPQKNKIKKIILKIYP